VLRFEPNPPALTLSTHGYEVIAREAIPAMTDVLIEPTAPRLFESGGIATVPATIQTTSRRSTERPPRGQSKPVRDTPISSRR
jgi:hypothetical protein